MSRAHEQGPPSALGTTPIDWLRFLVVSAYLVPVGLFLLASRRIVIGISLRRLAALGARVVGRRGQARAGALTGIRAEEGHCYLARAPWAAVSDAEGRSR